MTLDLDRLRALQRLYEESETAPPDAMVPNDVLGQVRANDRTYHFCIYINAVFSAAPDLLAIAEEMDHARRRSDAAGAPPCRCR